MTDMPEVHESIEVQAPVEEVYRRWTNFTEFPRFMENIKEVTPAGEGRYHWKAKGPLGVEAEWNANVVEEIPNQLIAWRSDDDDSIRVNGAVKFESMGPMTKIDVNMGYQVPAGPAGEAVAKLFSNPAKQTHEDLEHFKQMIESGNWGGGDGDGRAS